MAECLALSGVLPPLTICFQEKGRTHDFTLSLASDLSKKTSQLIKALNSPTATSSRKKHVSSEDQEANAALSRVETTSAVMMAAKHLLSWLDRNPSNLLEDYDNFRTEVLRNALDLSSILVSHLKFDSWIARVGTGMQVQLLCIRNMHFFLLFR